MVKPALGMDRLDQRHPNYRWADIPGVRYPSPDPARRFAQLPGVRYPAQNTPKTPTEKAPNSPVPLSKNQSK